MLKNVHYSYNEEDVTAELIQLKFSDPKTKITHVSKYATLKSKRERENRDLSIYRVQLSPFSQVHELTDIKYLLNQTVIWENINNTDMMQCYRCQRYNHTARNCKMPFRCVKCKNQHVPGECPADKIKADVAKSNADVIKQNDSKIDSAITLQSLPISSCVNCGQSGHPANYRKCPMYQ